MRIEYYSGGRKRRVTFQPAEPATRALAGPLAAFAAEEAYADAPVFIDDTNSQTKMLLTPSISLGNPKKSEVRWLTSHYGFQVQHEGLNKVLLSAPLDVPDRERFAANVAVEVVERGNVASAQPNFVRVTRTPPLTDTAVDVQWALDNPGNPGVVGADVAATAAWTINTGNADISVAVIDDGVEASHPALHNAIVAQRNFVYEPTTLLLRRPSITTALHVQASSPAGTPWCGAGPRRQLDRVPSRHQDPGRLAHR